MVYNGFLFKNNSLTPIKWPSSEKWQELRIHIAHHLRSTLYGRGIMDSELLLKFIGYFPDYLSVLSRTLLRLLWTTFVETAEYELQKRPLA